MNVAMQEYEVPAPDNSSVVIKTDKVDAKINCYYKLSNDNLIHAGFINRAVS